MERIFLYIFIFLTLDNVQEEHLLHTFFRCLLNKLILLSFSTSFFPCSVGHRSYKFKSITRPTLIVESRDAALMQMAESEDP